MRRWSRNATRISGPKEAIAGHSERRPTSEETQLKFWVFGEQNRLDCAPHTSVHARRTFATTPLLGWSLFGGLNGRCRPDQKLWRGSGWCSLAYWTRRPLEYHPCQVPNPTSRTGLSSRRSQSHLARRGRQFRTGGSVPRGRVRVYARDMAGGLRRRDALFPDDEDIAFGPCDLGIGFGNWEASACRRWPLCAGLSACRLNSIWDCRAEAAVRLCG